MSDKGTEVLSQKIQFGFNPGDMFSTRYQIIEEIGFGGMGKVFKAKDLELNEIIALKMIKPELSKDENVIARFKRELQLARELNHDNVIRIHDLGEIDGIKYISMKYIDGITLNDLIKTSGKLSVEKTTEITVQICAALDAAHNKGVIHRDLKPQNIMIDKRGRVILLDFGIARSVGSTNVTGTGVVLGTPDFISPEQIEGRKSSPRTDIYSLGIILYEMLTGILPFKADSPLALMNKHLNEIPKSPTSIESSIPKYFEDIILKCLEKKSEERYSDVKEIKDLLINADIKTNKLKVLKVKKTGRKRSFRYLKYIGYGLLAIYLIVSVMSLVVDFIYESKFEKLEVEYDTYYKNLYPIQKTWLPKEWVLENNNAWNYYMEFSGGGKRENALLAGHDKPYSITTDLKSKYKIMDFLTKNKGDIKEIRKLLYEDLNKVKIDLLKKGIRCSKITHPYYNSKYDTIPILLGILYINRYVSVQSRLDFIEGNYNAGLEKCLNNQIVNVDLLVSSRSIIGDIIAKTGLDINSKEIIPFLLSDKLEINNKNLIYFENICKIALKNLNIQSTFYKEYLALIKYRERYVKDDFNFNKFKYHLFEKVLYFKDWFSYKAEYYKMYVPTFLKIFKDLKFIGNKRNKSLYIKEFLKNNKNSIKLNLRRLTFSVNITRTMLKLVLNLVYIKKYGVDSKEYLKLLNTEIGINEFSGRKFEIIEINGEKKIVIIPNFNLSLKSQKYDKIYKNILEKFQKKFFSISMNFKRVFYNFDMD